MSDLSENIESLKKIVLDLKSECEGNGYSQERRVKLENVLEGLNKTADIVHEHELRDNLIDNMYLSIGSRLNTTFDLQELLGAIIDSLEKLIGFDAAGIFLVNLETGEIESDFIRGYHFEFARKIRQKVGEGILGWVIENGQSVNLGDVSQDPRYINARPETHSEITVPLISQGNVIGCINLESNLKDFFSAQSLSLLETFATQASLAVERARFQAQILEKKVLEEELSLARKIQLSLFPEKTPNFPGFEMAGFNLPSRMVGGDYYDFIPLQNNALGVAIADVAGKGLGAALTMSGFRAALRAEIRHGLPPAELMHKVNHFVYESTESGGFVTAFFGAIEGNSLKYINAGHNPPVIMRTTGDYELLEKGGLVLGFEEEQEFIEGYAEIESGDVILLYTDGVTEAMDAEENEFGIDGLIAVLKETVSLNTKERLQAIHRKIVRFSGKYIRRDDLTLVMIKRI